mgnify:CR=1 FL=1
MVNEKTAKRYWDYLVTYTNIISSFWEDLQDKCRKKRSGDITITRKKYMYFATKNWVTLVNKETNLELTFHFNNEEDSIYFEKDNIHSFIESDLNTSGLWKHFSPNQTIRLGLYKECLDEFVSSGVIQKKDNWFIINKEEIY